MTGKIGLAITTHKRPKILAQALSNWALYLDDVDELVVIHDRDGEGVASSKNRCIAALMDLGCEHHFYADDDLWPISDRWAGLYITDSEPHLMHCWGKSRFVASDERYTVWSWPRGVLLYVERRVIDVVGGMRTDFDGAGEHAEWSTRIRNAGFTTHRFADIRAARNGIWHALDYTKKHPSTLPASRYSPEATARRHELYEKYRGSTEFVEYRNG